MPELPEVESVLRGLSAAQVDAPLVKIWRSQYNLRIGQDWSRKLEKLHLLRHCIPGPIERRGKYLLWKMLMDRSSVLMESHRQLKTESNASEFGLVIHLGMSGQCEIVRTQALLRSHTHLRLQFADERELRFVDPRRFGGLRAGTWQDIQSFPPVANLGVEPLSRQFTAKYLHWRAGKSQRILRDILLDQKVIAGVGNIYAIEALFVAELHPLVPSNRLCLDDWHRLTSAIRRVLRKGIRNGGTTLKDFRDVHGAKGKNQEKLLAYGRAGLKCSRCGAILESFSQGGRSGAFCPKHQRFPATI